MIAPRCKLWMSSPRTEGVFGDGKWRLLQAVDQHGSLSGAADAMGMSYRKAWGDLKKAEKGLGVRLVERSRGGSEGGGTTVTEEGRRWIRAYTRYRAEVEKAIERAYRKHMAPLL